MKRLIEKIVFCGLVTAWRLATVPTRRSPEAAKATTDGVVRPPSAFSITVGSPPSRTAMHEFVVPRSIPMVLAMMLGFLLVSRRCEKSASCYSRSFTALSAGGRVGGVALLLAVRGAVVGEQVEERHGVEGLGAKDATRIRIGQNLRDRR